ncbi:porin [Paralcaligenes sp. KSB-10]|uniref:porin n=1 Tax=Paralcaligenes sp. KSB-10 TaxID=2901142 RepID=UPI001E45E397|nr:porin [Paralcaligenes sp. KSB-10]UHL66121.1 porin [Paralcaligenes sp. KSB-10]
MKKTLLAAALIAGFAGVAQAETSVTLYGIIDTGIGYNQVKGTVDGADYKSSKFGVINGVQSGSRWGLKGSEDLGDGLRAVFQLESGFDSSTGKSAQGGRLFGRQATIGLAGDSWGQLDFGRQTNIASKYLAGIVDPFNNGFGQANVGTSFSSANTLRLDNMVLYQTPNFSGFQFGVGYSFNADGAQNWNTTTGAGGLNPNDSNKRVVTTGLRYANGPIGVALTYDNMHVGSNVAANGGSSVNVSEWNLGASYDFEIVKASLAFGQTRNGWFQGTTYDSNIATPTLGAAQGLKVNSYLVGLSAPVGNGRVLASWQMADPRNAPEAAGDASLSKMQTYSLGYTYNLSKRTNLYAIGSYSRHVAFADDLKSTVLGVGIRHQF